MLNIYLDDKITLDQQVLQNKEDIAVLKEYIKEAYKTSTEMTESTSSISTNKTNAPVGTNNGWLLDPLGNLFKIWNNYYTEAGEMLTISFYCNIKGPQGVGISTIENDGYSQGEGFTISHIKATLTNGNAEYFDVQAKDGKDGTGGAEIPYITIEQPASATNGTLTAEQLQTLQSSDDAYILFNNEKYYLMDKETESGFLVYTHVGHDSTENYWTKCITITISTLGWVLNSTNNKLYLHTIRVAYSTILSLFGQIITNSREAFTVSSLGSYLKETSKKILFGSNMANGSSDNELITATYIQYSASYGLEYVSCVMGAKYNEESQVVKFSTGIFTKPISSFTDSVVEI